MQHTHHFTNFKAKTKLQVWCFYNPQILFKLALSFLSERRTITMVCSVCKQGCDLAINLATFRTAAEGSLFYIKFTTFKCYKLQSFFVTSYSPLSFKILKKLLEKPKILNNEPHAMTQANYFNMFK